QVHRLVAEAFIPKVENKDCVNHIDGNPSNNYLNNLEWCNHAENLFHAYKNKLNQSPDPLVLVNTITCEAFYFRSKAKASEFLGRNKGYVSRAIQKGEEKIDEYEIFTNRSSKKGV
ncbi:MAG: HNH endonuclease, partial [Enterococcus sp.]|nr:HNH endonuclease [Enterococcus sp.]